MTRTRRVSACLLVFGLLFFAVDGGALAGKGENGATGLRTASASATTEARIPGQQRLLRQALPCCTLTRILRLQVSHPSAEHLPRQHEGHSQISDLYLPSRSSHLLLLRYPLWFQFGPATNYSDVSEKRTIARAPLTAL